MIIHSILVAIPETKLKQPNGHCRRVHLPRGCQQYWARGQTALSGLESCSADDSISALHSIAKCQPSACQLFPEVGSLDHYFLRYSFLPSGNSSSEGEAESRKCGQAPPLQAQSSRGLITEMQKGTFRWTIWGAKRVRGFPGERF